MTVYFEGEKLISLNKAGAGLPAEDLVIIIYAH